MTTPPRSGPGSGTAGPGSGGAGSDGAGSGSVGSAAPGTALPGTAEPGRGGVLGVGVDSVHLPEFIDQLDAPGTRFSGSFSAAERRQATERAIERGGAPGGEGLARHLGVRWAAKEAVVKAWSAALYGQPPPVSPDEFVWSEIETVCDAWGRPRIRLSGTVEQAVADTVGSDCVWHVSLSHEKDTALAFVVLAAGG